MEIINTDKAPAAIGPYSQAIVQGELVFCSGQIGLDPVTMTIVEGGVKVEAKQVLANLEAVLMAAGSARDQVLKTTIFLTDMNDFTVVNEVYAEFFGDHKPARATVAVKSLPKNALVEIECVAFLR